MANVFDDGVFDANVFDEAARSGVIARYFDGVGDQIKAAKGALDGTGAFTLAAVVNVFSAPRSGLLPTIINLDHSTTGGQAALALVNDGGVWRLYLVGGTGGTFSAAFSVPLGEWLILVVSKAAGVDAGTMSMYRFSNSTWSHGTGWTTIGNAAATDGIFFGTWRGVGEFAAAALAVAAGWDRQLSQAEIETLDNGAATQAFNDVSGGAPDTLWDFNQASVATAVDDLLGTADQTAITGTTVYDDGPTGWTYGISGPPAAPTVSKQLILPSQAVHRAAIW